jgi:urea transport system substrate-binding protein
MIVNTIVGDTNVAFFRALRDAGITAEKMPTVSFQLGENEIRALPVNHLKGDYAVCSYFPSVNRPENTAFVSKFQKRYGAHRLVTDVMESAYVAVRIWARAATEAGDVQPAAMRPALRGLQINGPGGPVRIDPDNQYAWKVVRIARIGERGEFKLVSSSEEPVAPIPFPPPRKREDWLRFLVGVQK